MESNSKHIPFITIRAIPHRHQRYDTAGDYIEFDGLTHFQISEMEDPDFEFAVAIHELIEYYDARKNGIQVEAIDRWDKDHIDHPDPGSIPEAPYHESHMWATSVEKLIIERYGHPWDDYDKSFEKLIWRDDK